MSASIGLTKFPTASECDSSGSSLDPRRYTMLAGPSLCGNHIVQGNREGMASMKVIVSPGSPASLQGYRAVPGMLPLGRTNSWADRILRLRLRRQRDSAWKAEERGRDGAKKNVIERSTDGSARTRTVHTDGVQSWSRYAIAGRIGRQYGAL